VFRLATGADDVGLMLTSDYVRVARGACAALPNAAAAAAVEAFLTRVLPACTELTVDRRALLALLPGGGAGEGGGGAGAEADAAAAAADALMANGLLARHASGGEALAFSVPALGAVIAGVVAGRRELVALVSKRKYREVLERDLLGGGRRPPVRLRGSPLGAEFHVRDAWGMGALLRRDGPSGPLLRVPPRGA